MSISFSEEDGAEYCPRLHLLGGGVQYGDWGNFLVDQEGTCIHDGGEGAVPQDCISTPGDSDELRSCGGGGIGVNK